jgi:hypothetical protein
VLTLKGKSLIATLYIITNGGIAIWESGPSERMGHLKAQENEVSFSHVHLSASMRSIRAKREKLSYEAPKKIMIL